ncbi:phage holin family protein [Ruthenibacterium lactatiformans]|uniref:phage holin family protein n=1 Tax=Ruthenibacterium lactatiformans TaxID=1550024 RepID=UPI003FD74114
MTEIIASLQEYIKPELFVLVPLMFGLGAALKADKRFPSANIPYTLALVGMFLAAMYVMATAQLDSWQSVVLAVFTAIVQGGLCALASVGVHQVYKQAKEKKSEQ